MRKNVLGKVLFVIFGLAGLGLFVIGPKTTLAANPTTINFQGKVVNSNGTNVNDGTYSFVFRIYNSSSPTMTTSCTSTASCLWQETQASVTVTSGVFQVELGSACALTSGSCNNSTGGPINFASNNALYLTMQFNGDTSGANGGFMSPLIHMTSMPFALQADNAASLGGVAAANYAQLSTSNTGSITITQGLTIGSGQNVTVGSTAGSSIGACTGSNVVTGFQTLGGIVVAGTCSAPSSGTLASNYNSSGTSGNTIALSNSGQGVILQDASSSTITNLFAVQNNGGTSTYLAVTAANSGSIIVGNAANKITISSGSITTASGNLQVYGAGTTTIGNGTGAINLTAGTGSAISITALANSTWQVQGTSLILDTQSASDSTLTVSNSGAGNITLALDTSGIYAVGASNGVSISACTGSQVVNSFQSVGGIIVAGSCATPSVTLNNITAASAANTPINNGNYKQTWQWSLTSANTNGLLINESSASVGSGSLVEIDTSSGSSVTPLKINGGAATTVFQVQSNSVNALTVAANGKVFIGSTTTDSTAIPFQLDSYNTYDDSGLTCTTSSNQGAMYYNTSTNAIRACLNGAWEDLASTAGLGIMLFGVVPDSGSNPGDLESRGGTAHTTGPCKVSWKQNASAGNSAQVSVDPCVAYSGGRKVVVANTTVVNLDGSVASQWEHLCFNSSGAIPTTLSAATSTETNTTNDPNASYLSTHQGAPYLCLADILMNAGTGNSATVANIYDVRTFTTSTKEFDTSAAAMGLGVPAVQSGLNVTNTAASATVGGQRGVVVATDMSTSSTAPNVILATAGPTFAKAVGGTAGQIVATSATAARLTSIAIATTATNYYSEYGVANTTFPATTCTATPNATNCDAALYFFQSRR